MSSARDDLIERNRNGVRVGATPEPLTLPPVLKAALEWYRDEALALAINLEAERTMAVTASVQVLALDAGNRGITALALLERWDVALRAPEPLTAAARRVLHELSIYKNNDPEKYGFAEDIELLARAALEGGVSPQPSSSVHQTEPTGFRWRFREGKDKTWRFCERDPRGDPAVIELEPLYRGGAHQTENAGEAVQSPAGDDLKDKFHSALGRYWDCAYAEGKEGRECDDFEGRAQQTLGELLDIFDDLFAETQRSK